MHCVVSVCDSFWFDGYTWIFVLASVVQLDLMMQKTKTKTKNTKTVRHWKSCSIDHDRQDFTVQNLLHVPADNFFVSITLKH